MLKSLPKLNAFKSLVCLVLLLTTLVSFLNLTSISQTAIAAQSSEQNQFSLETANQETKNADINQVESDTNSNYKFGQRILAGKFVKTQIKNDICGQNLDLASSKLGSKFDSKANSTIIKVAKSKCGNSSISQVWLKLVWDNGLIGWIEAFNSQNLSQNSNLDLQTNLTFSSKLSSNFKNLLKVGSVQTFARDDLKNQIGT